MSDAAGPYRSEGGHTLIELRLDTVQQLFDTRDPSPFRSRDLEDAAADYIVEAAAELPEDARPKLVLHLPPSEVEEARRIDVAEAIGSFFAWRAQVTARQLRDLLRNGRLALVVGLAFLALCLALNVAVRFADLGWTGDVVEEGLIIVGWVALWRPAEIFLFDWWPLRRQRRFLERLAAMPVEPRAG
ncbi:MAG: hypothetical protein U1E14_14840 [Geminicoccaceae bacterium]